MSTSIAQPLRFLSVGIAGYAANVALFGLLVLAGSPYPPSAVAAYLLASTLMYVANRVFTFGVTGGRLWDAYARYMTVTGTAALACAALLALVVEGLGASPRPAQAAVLLAVTPAVFVGVKRWAFLAA